MRQSLSGIDHFSKIDQQKFSNKKTPLVGGSKRPFCDMLGLRPGIKIGGGAGGDLKEYYAASSSP